MNTFIFAHIFIDRPLSSLNPFPEHAKEPEPTTTPAPVPEVEVPKLDPNVKFVPPPESASSINLHDYDFYGEYVGWPLGRVCNESVLTPGLNYVCDNNSGGVGNIRNFLLTCIRYAIEAGATGLIMPRIQRRSKENLGALFTASFQPFDYFFDDKHFRKVMGEFCPQLVIYNKGEDIPHGKNRQDIGEFYPKALIQGGNDGFDERGINRHLDQYRGMHDKWLREKYYWPSVEKPVTVQFRWAVFFEWPIYRDGPEFATTFGDILRMRPDVEELARTTIDKLTIMAKEHAANQAQKTTEQPNIEQSTNEQPNNEQPNDLQSKTEQANGVVARKVLDTPYLGVHLRTEGDALGFWPNFDDQAKGYLKAAETHGLKFAYIATGDAAEGHRFGELAMKHLGMKVVGKTDLLTGADLKRLTALSWDQQALVDFLVLTKSSHFTGCSFSSFSMNIAIKRHTMTEGIRARQWKSPGDAYSTLVGRFENWFGDWMFMYECMWP